MKKVFSMLVAILGGAIFAILIFFSVGFILWNFDIPSWEAPLRALTVIIGLGLSFYLSKSIYQHIA